MQIKLTQHAGTIKPGQVRAYRKTPGDLNLAAAAAAHYARKNSARMVLVPGNSYGIRVYHIARETDDVEKFTAAKGVFEVVVVDVDGSCSWAKAE